MLLIPVLLPLLGGLVLFFLKDEKVRRVFGMTIVLVASVCAGAMCLSNPGGITLLTVSPGLAVTLRPDGLGTFFVCLVAVIWPLALCFAYPYMAHAGGQARFYGFFVGTQGVLFGLGMSANLMTLYLFYELMTLITLPLVIHDRSREAMRAGMQYLGYSVFGAGLGLFGFFVLGQYGAQAGGIAEFVPGGALDMAKASGHETLLVATYLVMMVGFGCKAGLLPLQAWLTAAHPVAPAPASAVLSGLITKGGVLAAIRVTYYLFGPVFLQGSFAQTALLILTLSTVFVGSMLALKEKVLKKRMAYSTVSQVSYVLFGVVLLTPGGLEGAMLQVVFHALAKDLLFLGCGAFIFAVGKTRVEDFSDIGRRMPVTTALCLCGALSLVGIPPFGGFVSKWGLAVSALEAPVGVFSVIGPAVLLVSALLTAGYLFPIGIGSFFPSKKAPVQEKLQEPLLMLLPMGILAALCLALGLFPAPITALTGPVLGAIFG